MYQVFYVIESSQESPNRGTSIISLILQTRIPKIEGRWAAKWKVKIWAKQSNNSD